MISVFYQSASISRILGSIPQGLISSVFIFSWFHRVLVISSPSIKGGFFQKVQCIFKISIINIPNHYLELKIWISCLLSTRRKFKFQVQDSDLESLFWRFDFPAHTSKQLIWILSSGKWFGIFILEIWQTHCTFWKGANFNLERKNAL